MHALTWKHTRKGTDMQFTGSMAQILLTIMRIRYAHPHHQFMLDGKPYH